MRNRKTFRLSPGFPPGFPVPGCPPPPGFFRPDVRSVRFEAR